MYSRPNPAKTLKKLTRAIGITRPRACALVQALESRTYLSADISFADHVELTEGSAPIAIVAGDFNGDQKEDLAVADAITQKITIFLGNGNGTFSAGPQLTLSALPTALVTGDFDHNGQLDLAAGISPALAGGSTGVTVFLNSGNASFQPGITSTILANQGSGEPVSLVSADFNNDGFTDLASADFSAGMVSVLIGTGIGTFQTPVNYNVGTSPTSLATGDFSGDGKLDLAVSNSQVDPNTSSNMEFVSILDGLGNGVFEGGGAATPLNTSGSATLISADLNGDNHSDIIAGDSDGHAIVLLNNGNDTFANSSTVTTADSVSAVAVADFNFDGDIDLVAANGGDGFLAGQNNVTVATGVGGGGFLVTTNFDTATQPLGLAVADFNGDHKPDIATANAGDGTVSILLNNTAGTVVLSTQTALQESANNAAFGQNLEFTATVTGPTGDGFPTGSVRFFDGATALATVPITVGTNQAVFDTTTLGVGAHHILARYFGDGTFGASTSSTVSATVTPTAGNGPDLVATFLSTTLPSQFVIGETALARFRITNSGNFAARGFITNNLYLSLDGTLDGGDIQLTMAGSLNRAFINLQPGLSVVLVGAFTVPADTSLNSYMLLLAVNATNSLLESDTTNNTAVESTSQTAVDSFGNVGGRANVVLTLPDDDGTRVIYRLIGPGIGSITSGDAGIDVSLSGTTAASSLFITGRGGNSFVDLHDLSSTGPVAAILGTAVNISGQVSLSGGASRIFLHDLQTGAAVDIDAGPSPFISLGTVTGTTLTSASGIKFLSLASCIEGVAGMSPISSQVVAPWIGTLISRGEFTSQLDLNGSGSPGGVTLRSATILGSISGSAASQWIISGDVLQLTCHGVLPQFNGTITGKLHNFVDIGGTGPNPLFGFSGNLAAASFGSILIRGSVSQANILAGANFGADGQLGGGDDSFAAGSIDSLVVIGNIGTSAVIAAGLDPVDGILLNGDDTLLAGGHIKSLTITTTMDPTARIVASSLPAKVRIGTTLVTTATDARFQI